MKKSKRSNYALGTIISLLIPMIFSGCSNANIENHENEYDKSTGISEYVDVETNKTESSDETNFPDETNSIFDESIMPDDFYFIFESWGASGECKAILDTKNNIIAKNPQSVLLPDYLITPGMFDYVSMDYYISEKDLQEFYFNIIKYNIREFNSRTENDDKWTLWAIDEYRSTANYSLRITFSINDKLYTVLFDTSILGASDTSPGYENPPPFGEHPYADLILFSRFLWDFYTNTEEYQSMIR